MSILVWLFISTSVIVVTEKTYNRGLIRDIQCVAETLILIAGSEELVKLIRSSCIKELDHDQGSIITKLGWF
jgi:hypothetical protein